MDTDFAKEREDIEVSINLLRAGYDDPDVEKPMSCCERPMREHLDEWIAALSALKNLLNGDVDGYLAYLEGGQMPPTKAIFVGISMTYGMRLDIHPMQRELLSAQLHSKIGVAYPQVLERFGVPLKPAIVAEVVVVRRNPIDKSRLN